MPHRYNIGHCPTLSAKPVFFDANILIYIFWPTGTSTWPAEYSTIFNTLRKQKNVLMTDVTVISEVINRSVRIEYDKYLVEKGIRKDELSFKKFRESPYGKETLTDIYTILKNKIMPLFHIIGKVFQKSDIEGFLHVDSIDFSDMLITSLCRDNNCILLTNDRDFASTDIDILSAHPALLRS
ncbi:MAG TPA: twitching motility protein PilT [Fibrobacteres bacterium]|nr:twitching motility protein PilT [Fibrobacterota bacterium]